MGSRLEFHEVLCTILGSRNVYYQPPESLKLSYPCIVYGLASIDVQHADGIKYLPDKKYEVTLVSREPEPTQFNKMLSLDYSSFGRHFVNDNLNHFTFTIYY